MAEVVQKFHFMGIEYAPEFIKQMYSRWYDLYLCGKHPYSAIIIFLIDFFKESEDAAMNSKDEINRRYKDE